MNACYTTPPRHAKMNILFDRVSLLTKGKLDIYFYRAHARHEISRRLMNACYTTPPRLVIAPTLHSAHNKPLPHASYYNAYLEVPEVLAVVCC